MPTPTRDEIKPKVIHNIGVLSGFDDSHINETQKLEDDLGLSDWQRGALAPGFQKIARAYKPAAVISMDECKKLETVKDSIDLVFKRAQ
jgi:hypothetical protein